MAVASAPMAAAMPRMADTAAEPAAEKKAVVDAPEAREPEEPPAIRSDFAETAFWQPHLLTGPDGAVTIDFRVPDSVTSWNVWVHALTRDLSSGSDRKDARSVKELMVRPYAPRFLREGDRAELKVVVNNASSGPLEGNVTLDIIDPETNQSLLSRFGLSAGDAVRAFKTDPFGGASVTFPVTAPVEVGPVAF